MRSRDIRLAAGAALLVLLALPLNRTKAATDAGRFIADLGERVLSIFNDRRIAPADRERRLRAIAVQSFDLPRIARSTLGRYWAEASLAERQEFTKVFERYMVHIYASRFGQYHDVKLKVVRERAESQNNILVGTEIIRPPDQPPIKADWWLRQEGAGYKIIDVNIEGISQLLTLREEFSTVIQRNGGRVSALIDGLREKTKE